ncbi:MAG: tRNA (adenosine(37)-N6)-threonylcarbamoyltransferase complex ATPase subunit type 1 TsaE [Phycisphaerales bacterium]|nr:tRNA (adenosine(37)-N6)-threonylcarbamoyltransferase complex ATPase subunit type 1 TsaE [Phycisphaerales bacterium]
MKTDGIIEAMSEGAVHLVDVEATEAAGARIACDLPDGAVLGLDGPLGAGKTTFVRGLAVALGVSPSEISSPTFTIVHEHPLPDGRMLRHVDAWRLMDGDALDELGWSQWIGSPGSVTVIEWASRIEPHLPQGTKRLMLDHADEGSGRMLVPGSPASGESP